MIYFNGEINKLEKIASPLVTIAIFLSISCYVAFIGQLFPYCNYYLK